MSGAAAACCSCSYARSSEFIEFDVQGKGWEGGGLAACIVQDQNGIRNSGRKAMIEAKKMASARDNKRTACPLLIFCGCTHSTGTISTNT